LIRFAQAGFVVFLAALSGCSLFHRGETPQNRFLDALGHGNNAEANQIWLGMTPDDRANLAHSEGIKPSVSKEAILQQLMQKTSGADDDESPADDNR
jgi:hypothetical protein